MITARLNIFCSNFERHLFFICLTNLIRECAGLKAIQKTDILILALLLVLILRIPLIYVNSFYANKHGKNFEFESETELTAVGEGEPSFSRPSSQQSSESPSGLRAWFESHRQVQRRLERCKLRCTTDRTLRCASFGSKDFACALHSIPRCGIKSAVPKMYASSSCIAEVLERGL